MRSQRHKIIEWMRKRPITAMGAFDNLGIVNLSGRISELRQAGYHIENEWAEADNRHGERVRFVRYRLVSEPAEQLAA